MIRGFFSPRKRPYFLATFTFPRATALRNFLKIPLLVDTGADRTLLSPRDAKLIASFGINISELPNGAPSLGVGGVAQTRLLDAEVTFGSSPSIQLTVVVLEPIDPPAPTAVIPSIMGRDILSRFALFLEERTNRVLLLDAAEADAVTL